jgi:hypothetical protein
MTTVRAVAPTAMVALAMTTVSATAGLARAQDGAGAMGVAT